MNEITAPALRGGQAMPFLAALGVLGLLAYELGEPDAKLGWPEPGGPARFSVSGMDSLDDLAASLAALASRMREADELLPGAGPDFPPRKRGKGTDPTRSVPFGTGREWAVAQQGTLADAPSWLRSVFATNDATSRQHRTPGRLLRHPIFDAGPGTVSMSTTLENARDSATEADAMLRSLTTGYRVPGSIGGYLDWRADRDGSQAGSAKDASTAFGDPVATWLGLMSIRLTALVADGDRAVCGMMPRASGRYLRKPLLWPVWSQPLRAEEVEVLLCHSAFRPVEDVRTGAGGRVVGARLGGRDLDRKLPALGVHAVFAASRLSKGNNDGAYGPSVQLWPTVE